MYEYILQREQMHQEIWQQFIQNPVKKLLVNILCRDEVSMDDNGEGEYNKDNLREATFDILWRSDVWRW